MPDRKEKTFDRLVEEIKWQIIHDEPYGMYAYGQVLIDLTDIAKQFNLSARAIRYYIPRLHKMFNVRRSRDGCYYSFLPTVQLVDEIEHIKKHFNDFGRISKIKQAFSHIPTHEVYDFCKPIEEHFNTPISDRKENWKGELK